MMALHESASLPRKGKRYGFFIVGDDSGNWEISKTVDFGWVKHGKWLASASLSSKNDWRNLMVDNATENNAGFRKAMIDVSNKYPEIKDWIISFDGPFKSFSDVVGEKSADFGDIVFYHGTSLSAWEIIRKEGLKPRSITNVRPVYGVSVGAIAGRKNAIYLTTQLGMARFAARDAAKESRMKGNSGVGVVLKIRGVDSRYVMPDEDSDEDTAEGSLARIGSIAYASNIPASKISLLDEINEDFVSEFMLDKSEYDGIEESRNDKELSSDNIDRLVVARNRLNSFANLYRNKSIDSQSFDWQLISIVDEIANNINFVTKEAISGHEIGNIVKSIARNDWFVFRQFGYIYKKASYGIRSRLKSVLSIIKEVKNILSSLIIDDIFLDVLSGIRASEDKEGMMDVQRVNDVLMRGIIALHEGEIEGAFMLIEDAKSDQKSIDKYGVIFRTDDGGVKRARNVRDLIDKTKEILVSEGKMTAKNLKKYISEYLDEGRSTYHGADGKFTSQRSAHTVTREGERFKMVRQLRRMGGRTPEPVDDASMDGGDVVDTVEDAKAKQDMIKFLDSSPGWIPLHNALENYFPGKQSVRGKRWSEKLSEVLSRSATADIQESNIDDIFSSVLSGTVKSKKEDYSEMLGLVLDIDLEKLKIVSRNIDDIFRYFRGKEITGKDQAFSAEILDLSRELLSIEYEIKKVVDVVNLRKVRDAGYMAIDVFDMVDELVKIDYHEKKLDDLYKNISPELRIRSKAVNVFKYIKQARKILSSLANK